MDRKKIISALPILIFLLNVLIFPSMAYGEERVTALDEGEAAPYAGTLFNTEAAARLIVEMNFGEEACQLRMQEALASQSAGYDLQITNLNLSLESLQTRHDQSILLRDQQIDFLDEQLKRKTFPRETSFVLGVLTGFGSTVLSAYAISTVAK